MYENIHGKTKPEIRKELNRLSGIVALKQEQMRENVQHKKDIMEVLQDPDNKEISDEIDIIVEEMQEGIYILMNTNA